MKNFILLFLSFLVVSACNNEEESIEQALVLTENLSIDLDGITYNFEDDLLFTIDGPDESNFIYAFDPFNPLNSWTQFL